MLLVLVIVATTWLGLAVAGIPVFLHLAPAQQRLMLPALPVFGAMVLIALLHWPAMVMPTPYALVVVVVILAAIGGVGWQRGGRFPFDGRTAGTLAMAVVLGVGPMMVAALPLRKMDRPQLVQPTLNNDAFAYVTLSSWLRRHPALDVPKQATDAPVFGYTRVHLDSGLRIGEELLQVSASVINGRDVASTWYGALITWVLMLPGAIWVAGRLFGLRSPVAAAGGFAIGTSSVVLSQVYNQNSAAVLGMVLAPLTVVLLAQALAGRSVLPRWAAPVALAALAGTYTEYLPVLAPGLILFVILRKPRELPNVIGRGAMVGAMALAASPFVWWNVVRSLRLESGITAPGVLSYFVDAPGWAIFGRIVGATYLDESPTRAPRDALLLAAAIAFGVVCLAARRDARRLWLSVIVGCVAVVLTLTFVHRFPYGQQRAVQISVPLVLMGVVCGYDRAAGWVGDLRSRGRRVPMAALATAALVGGLAFPIVNVQSSIAWQPAFDLEHRTIDRALLEGAAWARRFGGKDGRDVMVVTSNFFEQLWLTYELRDRSQVSWPFLFPDYMNAGAYDRWDGAIRRFALVGRDDYIDVDPGVVVAQNARFRMLDLSKGQGVLGVTGTNWTGAEPGPNGIPARWMGNGGQVLVIRTSAAPTRVSLSGGALFDLEPLPIAVATAENEPLANLTVEGGIKGYTFDVPNRARVIVILNNAKPAQVSSKGDDPRELSFYMTGVARG